MRKINRHLAEGRAEMRSMLGRIEGGIRCAELAGPLSRYVDGEASEPEREEVADHLRSCLACRATAKSYRQTPRSAALLPLLPSGSWLTERFHALAGWAQSRLPGRGQVGEAIVLGTGSTGGTGGGNGLATLAKLAVICAGAGGGTAACVASGVLPTPPIAGLEKHAHSESEKAGDEAQDGEAITQPSPVLLTASGPDEADPAEQEDAKSKRGGNETATERCGTDDEPRPTDPVEAEFGLEGGGAAAMPQSGGGEAAAGVAGSSATAHAGNGPAGIGAAGSGSSGSGTSATADTAARATPKPDRLPPAAGAEEFGP